MIASASINQLSIPKLALVQSDPTPDQVQLMNNKPAQALEKAIESRSQVLWSLRGENLRLHLVGINAF